jgi:hypothetical protein
MNNQFSFYSIKNERSFITRFADLTIDFEGAGFSFPRTSKMMHPQRNERYADICGETGALVQPFVGWH